MSETEIFWLGGRPGKPQPDTHLADEPAFVDAIGRACEAAGCAMRRFVSAKGPYGTWLAEIERDGEAQRVLWNGKEQQLILQVKNAGGQWEDPLARDVASQDIGGFVAGVEALLGDAAGKRAIIR